MQEVEVRMTDTTTGRFVKLTFTAKEAIVEKSRYEDSLDPLEGSLYSLGNSTNWDDSLNIRFTPPKGSLEGLIYTVQISDPCVGCGEQTVDILCDNCKNLVDSEGNPLEGETLFRVNRLIDFIKEDCT